MTFTAAAIQFEPTLFAKDANVAALAELVDKAASDGAELITTPEMATTGYCFHDPGEASTVVEQIPGPTTDTFVEIAARRDCYIVLGMPEVDPTSGLFYNSAVLIGPQGIIGTHRKTHPYIAEPKWAAPGNLGHQVFETRLGRIAMLICMDLHFVETARVVALQGADVICHISNWLAERTPAPYWISRAFENNCYVIESNRWGLERTVQFSGGTCIIEPDGTVTGRIDVGNGIVAAEIDIRRTRECGPARRPELYRELQTNTYTWNPLDFFTLYGHSPLPAGETSAVTVVQSTPGTSVQSNLADIEAWIQQVSGTTDLVVFPELSITGPVSAARPPRDVAETADGPSLARIADLAVRHGMSIVVGIAERDTDTERVYNSAVLLGTDGARTTYRQIHLSAEHAPLFDGGDTWAVVDLPLGRVGLLVGNDALLPESGRVLALRGCDLIVCPSALAGTFVGSHPGTEIPLAAEVLTGPDATHWHHMRVRAGENNVYFAFANAVDLDRGITGHSGVFGPDTFAFPRTEAIVDASEPGHATSVIDTTNLDGPYPTNVVRRKDLVLMRQPHHYGILSTA
ncbi:nitrilase-related carbon-nitrogen hydrolase [Rhodococcus sp. 14-2483-1-2]|uniref:nitrilase-related carbon-nitrogen hydrolase n=1 Tax=Rhodococcus sp. 14-2483-1-2 TaxID=2023147 RepID=UPI000B9C5398|nr:nitrilase-related carbon-nitrogen hydrolase [Rhodococcus sp. 14-2483-1-2]OZF37439.1 amidohydrolase [Rhodococcus sp. 14-2483-1-2]